jgi:peptide deformylase
MEGQVCPLRRAVLTDFLCSYTIFCMEIVRLGNDVLRQKAQPVGVIDDSIRALIDEMFVAMDAERGVGLAAPQVGKLIRLFVITAEDGVRRVFINPHIIASSDELVSREEGCLSLPGIYGNIVRPKKVTVHALNEQGKKFIIEADGVLSRAIQHENDHLDGVLFIDRADEAFRTEAIELFNKREARKKEKQTQKKAKAARIAAKIAAKSAPHLSPQSGGSSLE